METATGKLVKGAVMPPQAQAEHISSHAVGSAEDPRQLFERWQKHGDQAARETLGVLDQKIANPIDALEK